MKSLLSILLVAFAAIACNETPMTPAPPQDNPGSGVEDKNFTIIINKDKLSAYSVSFDIVPADKERLYYYDIISKGRLSEADAATIKEEIITGAQKLADLTGSSFDEVLATMLSSGDKLDICSNAGYRPETDFVVYAFYWDDQENEMSLAEFSTPAIEQSSESIEVEATVDTYSIVLDITPSAGVAEYWYYFNERSKVEAMLASLEDENAYLSYHAMNVGTRKEGSATIEQLGLKPETEYMALLMCIDNKLNRFMASEVFTTTKEQTTQLVESELFEKLLGEWEGKQTIYDYYASPQNNEFTVNILSSVEDVDYDYRAMNQLVATVDGWCNIPYYGLTSLIEQEIEEPETKWGPKWVFNIAEGDVITMDGKVRNSVVGWLFFGDCFMLNVSVDGTQIITDQDFVVEVSEDYNTLTIKSTVSGFYPGLAYYFDGFGWMGHYSGCSDIVLTRK